MYRGAILIEQELTKEELRDFKASALASGEELDFDHFPALTTLSARFFFRFIPVAKNPTPPEVVFMPILGERLATTGTLATWNSFWEASQFRKEVFEQYAEKEKFGANELVTWIKALPEGLNAFLVPETSSRYEAYTPLYHLLPSDILRRFGLPALRRGIWPNNIMLASTEQCLPSNMQERLARAFAAYVWPWLDSGSAISSFGKNDPLVMLSHNLDFWLGPAVRVIEERMRGFKRTEPENAADRKLLRKFLKEEDPDAIISTPRMGGTLWMGEEEAREITGQIVTVADEKGKLRGIIDAVRSNRVEDDFSHRWSYAKEDFERKMYAKRSKIRVTFVELEDTVPVHSSLSEYTDDLLWEDFSAVLDRRERHVIVCLRNGTTKLGDIAASLGYANHSPISKALNRIRRKASAFFSNS